MPRQDQASRGTPERFTLPLYYRANPWQTTPSEGTVAFNVTVIGALTGKNAKQSLEVHLVQVNAVGTPVIEPKDKETRQYMIDTIIHASQEQSNRTVKDFSWYVVDFSEEAS
jgi:hypothetical protein